jgi:phenylpropionate dioxygenase-like ring-hydroxylating dioxygenase large terminal subunit
VVYQPTRGDAPPRLGPGVAPLPGVGGSTLDADVYRDPQRYERERTEVLRKCWLIAGRSEEIPEPGDWLQYEGHGETVVVCRQDGGAIAAFHNVCQHRGARICQAERGAGARRFVCPWHGWVYDGTGDLVGVPEREDFDPKHLEGLRTPEVAVGEWAGWIWINLSGSDAAPTLHEWIGADILTDLGQFRMEDMHLREKLVFDIPSNYKAIVDGFNEVYHVTELHHVDPAFTKMARDTTFHLTGINSMMFVPRSGRFDPAAESIDHHQSAICHYVVFPNSIFNNNPTDIQLFQPIPMAVDRTRFICWELMYRADTDEPEDTAYRDRAENHWQELKDVVAEDLFVFGELDHTRHSMGYRRNVFSERECKPTAYHDTMERLLAGTEPLDLIQEKSN